MGKYIKLFDTHAEYEEYIAREDAILPNVSYCEDVVDIHYNPWTWANEYFTTVALENGAITFTPKNNNVISYSTDNGDTWIEGNSVNVENGDKVLWKGEMIPQSSNGIGSFSSTCNFEAQGNTMSLLYGDNFKNQVDLSGKTYCFYYFFYDARKLISAENLSLPATTLANNCYQSMFYGCSGLTSAPQLPATTLANYCYREMFSNCTSLTTAPELPAITLKSNCYNSMFSGCTTLNYIKAMFTTTPGTSYTKNWVSGVASSGTFVKNSAATWTTTGVHGVPTGWTVQTASS